MGFSLNNLNLFDGLKLKSVGIGLLILFLVILVLGLIGFGVYIYMKRKKLKYTIPLYKMIGARAIKIAVYKAQDFKVGFAGDVLWYVPKIKKFISMGTIQTAPNEYPHFVREDGEWINFGLGNIDEQMKLAKVKYVASDMRSQRIAISNMLEQRFKGKQSWWDKYGSMITQVIFYLIVAISMVMIFYQWSGIVDSTAKLLDKIEVLQNTKCPATNSGVVPAFIMLMFRRKKK
jgi:hypothetical protein